MRHTLKRALLLASILTAAGCGNADSSGSAAEKCRLSFEVKNPELSEGSWIYRASVPKNCSEILTDESGTVRLAIKVDGIEDNRYTLARVELDGQTEPLTLPESLSMESGSIDHKTKTPWKTPFGTFPSELRLVVTASDGSSPTNSIESLAAELSIDN